MNQRINEHSIEATWEDVLIHSASVAEKSIRQENTELYYVNYIKSFPVLSHEEEMHLGQEMDEAREQMMLAAFGTQAGVSMILRRVSAFCNGELKLKDIIGHRQMESDEREESSEAIINGVKKLTGARVSAPDLRAGAALVIAGLAAEGITIIDDIMYIQRGYEDFEGKLQSLGAEIEKVNSEKEIQKFRLRVG